MKYRLILKEDTYPKTLYHISDESNLDKIVMKPRVPDMPIKGEDSKIKRISFSETIDGCLAGIFPLHPGVDLNDSRYTDYPNGYDFYVYAPVGDYSYVSNKEILQKRLVPDASLSKEVWITSPVKVKKIGIIHVEPFSPKTAKLFTYTMHYKDKTKKGLAIKFKWRWVDRIKESYLREDYRLILSEVEIKESIKILKDKVKKFIHNPSISNAVKDLTNSPEETLNKIMSEEFSAKFDPVDIKEVISYSYNQCKESGISNIISAIFVLYVFTNLIFNHKLLQLGNFKVIKRDIDKLIQYSKKHSLLSCLMQLAILVVTWIVMPIELFKAIAQGKYIPILLGVLILLAIRQIKVRRIKNLREDFGNTPKGYKDITHIIEECNKWFEANADKNCNICWNQHVQIRNWALELKKYRRKFGPITFERDLKKLKLKPKSDNEIKMNLDRAILHAFSNWRKNKFNVDDKNRELMYCLIELKEYRKKFGKDKEFSCRI